MVKKISVLCLCFIIIVTMNANIVFALAESDRVAYVGNDYLDVYVNRDNGRFTIETKEGHPLKKDDNNKFLLFADQVPDTSFTTFRINGKDYIYGNDYGILGTNSYFIQSPVSQGLTNLSQWHVEGLEITQTLTLVNDKDNPNLGNVKISYEVKNVSGEQIEVGSRILLDTMLGAQDASPIYVEGSNTFITHETELDHIPQYWRAVDDPITPKVISYGFLKGWSNNVPDRMIVAHWNAISKTKWNYEVNNYHFTSSNNPFATPDSAVALYWNPETIEPGEQIVYETYYGLGSFYTSEKKATYASQLFAPQILTLNDEKSGYEEQEFDIILQIDNTTDEATPMEDVYIQLGLPVELELVGNQDPHIYIPFIEEGEIKTITWRVKANPQVIYKAVRYWTNIKHKGSEEVTVAKFVVMPAVTGVQPSVQWLDVMPNKLYVNDEKHEMYIKGKGFSVLHNNWDMKINLVRARDGKSLTLDDYIINSDQQMVVNLDSLWQDRSPDAGEYTLQIDAGEYGFFNKKIDLTADQRYQSRSYGLLAIVSDNRSSTYSIIPLSNEEELKQVKKEFEEVLLEIRGKIQVLEGSEKTTTYIVEPGATINSVILFEDNETVGFQYGVDQTITIEKKENDWMHSGDFILIEGTGILSIPNFPFVAGQFSIELEDGTDYALDADEEEDEVPVEINWDLVDWLNLYQRLSNFPVTIKNAVIGDKSVSFGGSVALDFNINSAEEENEEPDGKEIPSWEKKPESPEEDKDPFTVGIDLEEARFGENKKGKFDFLGLRASGNVGLPNYLVPGMKLGADASLSIDTFKRKYELEADVSFKVIEINGLFTLRFTESSIPILDNFVFAIGGEPGIPIIPIAPIAYITRGGGGFENLYDTIMGNYNIFPPLKLVLIGGMDLAKVVSVDEMRLESALNGFSFDANMQILGFDLLDNVYGSIHVLDSRNLGIDAEIGATLTVFDIITGDVGATFSYNSGYNGIFGPVSLSGFGKVGISIPDYVPAVGGEEVAGVSANIGTSGVSASFKVLLIPVKVSYEWGDSKPDFDVFSLQPIPENASESKHGLMQQEFTNDQGKTGTITYGENIRVVSSTKKEDVHILTSPTLYAIASTTSTQHFTLPSFIEKYGLVEFKYSGELDMDQVKVMGPDHSEYELIENENYRVQEIPAEISESGRTEKRLYISFVRSEDQPFDGEWTINSPIAFDEINVMEALPLPEIETLQMEQRGDQLDIQWKVNKQALGNTVAFYVTEDNESDTGTLIKDKIFIDQETGSTSISIPETTQSGEYFIRMVIHDDGQPLHQVYSDNSFTVQNKNEPAAPEQVYVEPIGNGLLHVEWTAPTDATVPDPDGYLLQIMESKDGQVVPLSNAGVIEVPAEQTEAIIGGMYRAIVTDESDGNGYEWIGMEPGKNYQVSVAAYTNVGDVHVYGTSTISNEVNLPEPDPAEIQLTIDTDNHNIKEKVTEDGRTEYWVNQETIQLNVQSDQPVNSELWVNENLYRKIEGKSWQQSIPLQEGINIIEVRSVNEQGDISTRGLQIQRDTKAPDLKVDSPSRTQMTSETFVKVRGTAEPNAIVTLDGEPIETDLEGYFESEVSMEGYFVRMLTIAAEDEVGNRTEYVAEIINQNVDSFDSVEIQKVDLQNDSLEQSVMAIPNNGMQEDVLEVEAGETIQFQLVGKDADGTTYVLDQSQVSWDFLLGEELGTMNDAGMLSADYEGELVILASYAISGDYALEDSLIVKINSNESTDPEQPSNPGESDEEWYIPDDPNKDEDDEYDEEDNNETDNNENSDNQNNEQESVDRMMEDILQSIIEAEQDMEFITFATLSDTEDTVVKVGDQVQFIFKKQDYPEETGVGIGKVTVPERYITERYELLDHIYGMKLNNHVRFEQAPEMNIRFGLIDAPDPAKLGIYGYNEREQRWEYVGGEVDAVHGTVTAELKQFSTFALLYDAERKMFADVEGRWSENTVYRLASIGVIDGYTSQGNWLFAPEQSITREAFMKLLVVASGVPLTSSGLIEGFSDKNEVSDWANPYLITALNQGWVSGSLKDGLPVLEPKRTITRAEAAVLIYRLLEGKFQMHDSINHSFKDADSIPDWARHAITVLQNEGIMSGYTDHTFRPQKAITREEAAQMIVSMLDWLYNNGMSIQ